MTAAARQRMREVRRIVVLALSLGTWMVEEVLLIIRICSCELMGGGSRGWSLHERNCLYCWEIRSVSGLERKIGQRTRRPLYPAKREYHSSRLIIVVTHTPQPPLLARERRLVLSSRSNVETPHLHGHVDPAHIKRASAYEANGRSEMED